MWIIDASVALKWVIPEVLSDKADRFRAGDERRLNHPVYDCVYLALADREQASFVTADRRLLRRVPPRTLQIAVVDLRTI